jgi:mycobactin phenyloxazoline synthetase
MELEVAITEQVKQILKLVDQTISSEANLIEFGLHSLAIMQLVNTFQEEYDLDLNYVDFAAQPTIKDWVNLLRAAQPDEPNTVTDEDPQLALMPATGSILESPLSDMQYSFWAGQQSTDVSAHLYVEFDGQGIDPDRLNQAIRLLLQMHPMLRATISENGLQTIGNDNKDYQINIDDLRDADAAMVTQFLLTKRHILAHRKLAIEQGQVIDFDLTLLPDQAHRLHIDVNMIAADATSILLIYADLAALYEGKSQQLETCSLSYFEYLQRQEQDQALQQAAEQDQTWWKNRLADIAPPPKLPMIATQFREDSYKCDSLHHILSKHDKQALTALAEKYQVSLSTLMLSVFAITVGYWSSSNRFRLNLPLFKRQPYGDNVDRLVGDFTNLLIFSVELFEDEAFGEMLQRLEREREQCLAHDTYSGINVLRDLSKLHQDTEVAPIVYTCGFEQGPIIADSVSQTFGAAVWCVSQGPMVDLDVQVAEHQQGILINWDFRTAAFQNQVINSMFETHLALIQSLVYSPQQSDFPFTPQLPLVQRQARQLSSRLNRHQPFVNQSLQEQFWQQVKHSPDNTALIVANQTFSYRQLGEAVTTVATHLKAKQIQSGDYLAVALDDASAYVITTLAILTLGATYIVFDSPPFTPESITRYRHGNQNQYQYLITDCVMTDHNTPRDLTEIIPYAELTQPISGAGQDLFAEQESNGQQIAYIVPDIDQQEMVGVSHQVAVSRISSMIQLVGLNQTTCLLSLNSHSHKVSALDIFATLSTGGTLVLVEQLTQSSPQQWIKLIQHYQVNTLHAPSQRLNALVNQAEPGALASLALTLSGGRTATRLWKTLRKHNQSLQLVALGEAKHAAFYTSFNVCDACKATQTVYLSYGRPLPGIDFKIINAQGYDCPDFVMGQLWISGPDIDGNNPQLAGDQLAAHHKAEKVNWYHTGNFAYYQHNSEIHVCGPTEHLLHHQGYVIELQHINTLIATVEGVLDVSVHPVTHQETKILIAGIVVEDNKVDQQQIHRHLTDVLPHHLLPSYYWLGDALPVTSNGQVDTQTLLSYCLASDEGQTSPVSPSSLLQAVIFICAKTIGIDVNTMLAEDDFFESGGDSLLATHLTAAINQYFKGSELSIVDIFVERTPANLAVKINEKLPDMAEKIAQVLLKVIRKKS